MSYESPIEIAKKMSNQIDGDIMNVILSYGIKVDKNELIKALSYDRGQYEKGYTDGQKAGERTAKALSRELDAVVRFEEGGVTFTYNKGTSILHECESCGTFVKPGEIYCHNCGARLEWNE